MKDYHVVAIITNGFSILLLLAVLMSYKVGYFKCLDNMKTYRDTHWDEYEKDTFKETF